MATTTTTQSGHQALGPLSSQVRALRESVGLTRNQLAGLASCSPAFIANVEQGYLPKHSPTLARILEAMATYDAQRSAAHE